MLTSLVYFLIACLVLVVVLWVAKVILDQLTLPANVKQIAYVVLGVVGLIVLLLIVLRVFGGGAGIL